MSASDNEEFDRIMTDVTKRTVVWYRDQDFSAMNEGSRAELESLFTEGNAYDPMAGVQIALNLIMIGTAWQDRRVLAIAGRVAQVSSDVKMAGRAKGKAALRRLLDEISELLKEPGFNEEG
ncbi:hypothetical protein V8O11_24720 [Erwinia aphidicola]|uniref:Uncharacterized protein n=1 Tax=Erwinia aphidicola TaxID=68334 RepID=A0ABU8DMN9_ERWAP